jgi:glycosyltransferase involved in cell wall biosynthesis
MIFLIQSPHGWRDLWQRPHHLASRFAAAGHTVRWVEPRYLKWLLTDNARFVRSRTETPSPNLQVRSVTLLNGERFGRVRESNRRRLLEAVEGDDPGPLPDNGPRILWLYNPHESHLADSVRADLVVYDIMDEYRGFPWSPPTIEADEDALLCRADWVFAGTQALHETKSGLCEGRIECILSGVDTAHFARARTRGGLADAIRNYPDIAQLRSRHSRLIGYAGMLDLRIDQELIAMAAGRRPDWGWVCIGEARTDVSMLQEMPNVHLLGPLPYADLPAYYASWDVGLVPFRENRLTVHANPTKILEYAAAGLPIVAPALPEIVRFYSDGALLYRTDEEFLAQLDSILNGDMIPAERPEVREHTRRAQLWSERRSWDAIAGRMLARVEQLLAAR